MNKYEFMDKDSRRLNRSVRKTIKGYSKKEIRKQMESRVEKILRASCYTIIVYDDFINSNNEQLSLYLESKGYNYEDVLAVLDFRRKKAYKMFDIYLDYLYSKDEWVKKHGEDSFYKFSVLGAIEEYEKEILKINDNQALFSAEDIIINNDRKNKIDEIIYKTYDSYFPDKVKDRKSTIEDIGNISIKATWKYIEKMNNNNKGIIR